MARHEPPAREDLPLGLAPRTLVVTGKGGVGKSVVAASMAMAYRKAGVRTLLVEIEGHSPASALISDTVPEYEPTPLAPRLHALRIDPENALREYARMRLKVKTVSDRLVSNPIFEQFAEAAPGFRELLVLGKLWSLANDSWDKKGSRFEAIVVDGPATGHGLGLLNMAGVVARMFPVGPIATEARTIDAFVRSDRLGVVLVALPEDLPVTETIELRQQLADQGVAVPAVVLNGLVEDRLNANELRAVRPLLDSEQVAVRAAADAALLEHDLALSHSDERIRLEKAVGDVFPLPRLFVEKLGRKQLAQLTAELMLDAQERARARAHAGVNHS